jgi:heme exporter protein A
VGGVMLPGGAAGRAAVGLISHHSMLYPALTARENVEFAAKLHGVRQPRGAASRILAALRVDNWADAPVRALSRGLQQRVSIARALVHGPKVVLLDEPFTGLDAAGSTALGDTLGELKDAGVGLILVTHHLQEGLALATHVAVMRDGQFMRYESREAIDGDAYAEGYRELAAATQ